MILKDLQWGYFGPCGIFLKTSHLELSVIESMTLAIDSMAHAKGPDDWIEVTSLTSVNESMTLVNDGFARANESMTGASDSFRDAKSSRCFQHREHAEFSKTELGNRPGPGCRKESSARGAGRAFPPIKNRDFFS